MVGRDLENIVKAEISSASGENMIDLFKEPLFYIYFIYGLSFVVMTYVLLGKFHDLAFDATDALVSTFYMLVVFSATHGTAELIDWMRFIITKLGAREADIFLYMAQFFAIVSFVFLLQFGVNLMTYRSEKKRLLRAVPAVLFVIYLAAVFALGISTISTMGLIARYGFGFAGAALSAIMFFRLSSAAKTAGNDKLTKGLRLAAAGFACYAVFGGLITTPVFGLPVQLFRAACAFTIAIASTAILDVFRVKNV
jgi:hypothetical protein